MKRAGLFLAIATSLPLSTGCSGGNPTQRGELFGELGTVAPVVSGTKGAAATPKAGGGAPSVTAITFRPPQGNGFPTVNDTITANAATVDPDGEGVTVDWKWTIAGTEAVGELSDTLRPRPGRWKKNDRIEVEATPRDTKGNVGTPSRSFILIRNSTPAITSRPTGSLNGYRAVVTDPDAGSPNERFKWTLEAPVPGFTLGDDGTLKFDAVAGKAANGQTVTIVVTDSAGALAKQTFDVKL